MTDSTSAIDIHAHYLPESAVAAHASGADWYGTSIQSGRDGVPVAVWDGKPFEFGSALHFRPIEERLAQSEARGVGTEVLSLLPPLFRYDRAAEEGIIAARELNDELSALTQRFPGRLLGLASLPLQAPAAAADELARAVALPGIVGVAIGTHVRGVNLDAPELEPVFAAASDAGAFVFIHPIAPRDRGALDQHFLRNVIGNPFETTVAAASLVASGRLDHHAGIDICLAHGGGYFCSAAGRLAHAERVRPEFGGNGSHSAADLIGRFYYDTLVHDSLTLRQLMDAAGADRVLLGTDFPADMGQDDAATAIGGDPAISADEKDAVLHGNARRVLGL